MAFDWEGEKTRLTEYEKALLRKFRHGTVKLETGTLQILESMTEKLQERLTTRPELAERDIKDLTTLADANVRYLRLTQESQIAAEKIAAQKAKVEGGRDSLDPSQMSERELRVVFKTFAAQLTPEKLDEFMIEIRDERRLRSVPKAG